MNEVELIVSVVGIVLIAALWYWFFGPKKARQAEVVGNVQEVRITIRGGYSPTSSRRKGIPLRLIFDRQENSDCTSRVVFPDFQVSKSLPAFGTAVAMALSSLSVVLNANRLRSFKAPRLAAVAPTLGAPRRPCAGGVVGSVRIGRFGASTAPASRDSRWSKVPRAAGITRQTLEANRPVGDGVPMQHMRPFTSHRRSPNYRHNGCFVASHASSIIVPLSPASASPTVAFGR
jgi:hypothetical protein